MNRMECCCTPITRIWTFVFFFFFFSAYFCTLSLCFAHTNEQNDENTQQSLFVSWLWRVSGVRSYENKFVSFMMVLLLLLMMMIQCVLSIFDFTIYLHITNDIHAHAIIHLGVRVCSCVFECRTISLSYDFSFCSSYVY